MAGTQWTDEEREDAYMRWAYEFDKNLALTHRELDIPERTLQYWKKQYGWDARYAAETSEIAGLAFEYGINELRMGISAAALQLVKDASNSKLHHSERLASQRLLFSLMIGSGDELPKAATHLSLVEARHIHLPPSSDNHSLNPSTVVARALESNISHATELQARGRRGGRA